MLSPLGDRAVLIRLGDRIDEPTHRRVRALCERLTKRPVTGMVEVVPAFTTLAVYFDPAAVARLAGPARSPYATVASEIEPLLEGLDELDLPDARSVEIPVCYGGDLGPDLPAVAASAGLTPAEVIERHARPDYLVYMIGFAPGFPYLGGLDPRLATPRRASPRTAVPAGSVAIGGEQTGVYPLESPGGWNLIGRTPVRLFTPDASAPTLLRMGDRVRFRPISRAEHDARE